MGDESVWENSFHLLPMVDFQLKSVLSKFFAVVYRTHLGEAVTDLCDSPHCLVWNRAEGAGMEEMSNE